MQEEHEVYPGSGERRPYVQRGGGGIFVILHRSACTGENTSVLSAVLSFFLALHALCYSLAPPFIDEGGAQDYIGYLGRAYDDVEAVRP